MTEKPVAEDTRIRLREDAAKFLELLLTPCEDQDEHHWTKCRHCLAVWEVDGNQPLARGFLEMAIQALRAAVLDTEGDRMKIPSDNEVVDFLVAYHGYQNRATFVASLTDDRFNEVRLIQAWATLTRAGTE